MRERVWAGEPGHVFLCEHPPVFTQGLAGKADHVLAPGFDSYAHRVSVQSYDVTSLLTAGENVVGLMLADGWWAGRIGLTGSSAQWGDRTAAIWQLHEVDPGMTWRALYRRGMTVGRDHIASTVYTIVFAYAGASLPLIRESEM